jgi:hypothetical protein
MFSTSAPRRPALRGRRTVLSVMVTALAWLALGASAAHAAGNLDTDNVTLDGGAADFGNNPHLFGAPTQPGTVSWSGTSLTGTLTARVQGLLYHDDLWTGRCVRVTVVWERADLSDLNQATRSLCRTNGGLAASSVDVSFQSSEVRFVFISVQVQRADGTFRATGPTPTQRVAFLD